MKTKTVFMVSLIILIAAVIIIGVNWFILPLPDMVIRVTGILMLADIIAFTYSVVRLKMEQKLRRDNRNH
ncbi:hypothetical protein [Acetanaerobacterium elongatum]|uniref:Uncharacterized protein n=1 Tax=Acetanaerobacterium elongatum TaxID=258515 RepID=A0A1G9WH34_9FIRM|nr:hypothetical protein [Acetanaerobacterium elongatum]SDM83583.1 hypothetical protein SAMN05192585_10610 [Acetanaerobacterium elongatum]